MTEFLVLYEEPHMVKTTERETMWEHKGHTLVVQAPDPVQAFVAAFDYLTRRGHMVRTMKAGEVLEELLRVEAERRRYDGGFHVCVVAGLNLDQMQQAYQAGVPVIGGKGDKRTMTSIISIQPYAVAREGTVVTVTDDTTT